MATFEGTEATLHYEQIGDGPDVVWVSGGGGLATDWVPVSDALLRRVLSQHHLRQPRDR